MKLRIEPRKLEPLKSFFKSIPRGTTRVAVKAAGDFLLGDDSHGLKSMNPYQYASRSAAYGYVASDGAPAGYFSWRQFRFVMALVHSAGYHPGSRNDTTRRWQGDVRNDGYQYVLRTDSQAAYYTMSDEGQSRQAAMAGHDKVSVVIRNNISAAMREAYSAIQQWLGSNKPK